MNEVSSRLIVTLLELADVTGIPRESVLEGVRLTEVQRSSTRTRVDWEVFARMMDNIHAHLGSDEALIGFARHWGHNLLLSDALADLTRQKLEFEGLVATISDGVLILEDGAVLFANARMHTLLAEAGLPQDGAELAERLDPENRDRLTRLLSACNKGRREQVELRLASAAQGERVWEVRALGRIRWGNRDGHLLLFGDISERRALELAVARAGRHEREQIAHDLHDGVGQSLAAAALKSASLARKLQLRNQPEADMAAELTELVQETGAAMRSMAHALSPLTVEARGFVSAVEELAHRSPSLTGISCRVERSETWTAVPDAAAAVEVYRILQECLHNARRHGGAAHAVIRCAPSDLGAWFIVEDDGQGFPTESNGASSSGIGLAIMRHRAASFGGRIRTGNRPEGGARIECHVPASRLCELPARPQAAPSSGAPSESSSAPGTRRTRIVIADDHPVFRVGLGGLLETDDSLEVVAAVDSLDAVDEALQRLNPDVLITDLLFNDQLALDRMPGWRARHPSLRLVVVSMYPEHSHEPLARAAGADGYVTKHRAAGEIVRMIGELIQPS